MVMMDMQLCEYIKIPELHIQKSDLYLNKPDI